MKKQTMFKLITTIAIFVSMGGCVKQKAHTKQAQTITSSSTKEDREVLKQKQLAYLKEHEQEIVDFVKSKSSKVESVQIY
jgi:Ni/Co efflux regulator RcnB